MRSALLFLALAACVGVPDEKVADDTAPPEADEDGDGYRPSAGDCDDGDAAVHPDAAEACDGVDQDCDGAVDEDVTTAFYADADGDGFGDADGLVFACAAPDGTVADNDDCDDADATVHPGAPEDDCADPVDRNCDGAVGGADGDGDGWVACRDCDDASADVSPEAVEACNARDDDCDGAIDEDGATGEVTGHYDGDGDGYGNPAATREACELPEGFVADATDCDDGAADASPAGVEACDGRDNDCDGETDEDGAGAWYADADGDGYGDAGVSVAGCDAPAGFVASGADCDDGAAAVSPASAEVCDGIDNDCDGAVDEAGGVAFYADVDGDGYGDPGVVSVSCTAPAGYVADGSDCDDTTAGTGAGAAWFYDADGDGYGSATATVTACAAPSGYAAAPDDCDDGAAGVSPGAAEVCGDGIDQDCDGVADQDCPDTVTHCGTISADETWSSEDLHVVTCDVYVQGSAAPRLTIEDGATVTFAPGVNVYVGWGSYGELVVEGASAGVVFTSSNARPAPGDWGGLTFGPYDTGSVVEGATVEYAGANGYGALYAYYTPLLTVAGSTVRDSSNAGVYAHISALALSDSEVTDSADDGVHLSWYAALDGAFSGNRVSGSGGYPLVIGIGDVGLVDATNALAGNASDAVYVRPGNVGYDTTIVGLDVPWYVTGDVTVEGTAGPTLTVEEGAELRFAPWSGLSAGVGAAGSLVVDGGAAGATFTSAQATPAPGDWDGVYLGASLVRGALDGATIRYAGNYLGALYVYEANAAVTVRDSVLADSASSGLYASWYATVDVADTTLRDNADYGVYLQDTAAFSGDATFTGNVVTGNDVGVRIPAAQVGGLAADGAYTGNTTDDVAVDGDTIEADAVMRKLDAPWRVLGDVYVSGWSHPTLAIDDGVEVRFDGSAGIYVGTMAYGALDVAGGALGVTLTSSQATPAPGDWDGIWLGWYTEDTTLTGCDIGYAGGNGYGNLVFSSAGVGTTGVFTVDGCTIHDGSESGVYATWADAIAVRDTTVRGNADYGLYFDTNTGLETTGEPTFTGNTVTGNGLAPLVLPAGSADQLDTSSTFSGNGDDTIALHGGYVTTTGTWPLLDAGYVVTGDVSVEASTNPVLTIAPGVTLTFGPNAAIAVGTNSYGQLQAVGTAAAPVVFTSAQATPHVGDWDGLRFGWMDTGSVLSACEVRYGGGWTANVYLESNGSRVTIADCTVASSASYGIYRYLATPTITGVTYAGNTSGDLY